MQWKERSSSFSNSQSGSAVIGEKSLPKEEGEGTDRRVLTVEWLSQSTFHYSAVLVL